MVASNRHPVPAIASQIAGFRFNPIHTYPLTTNAFAHITTLTNTRSIVGAVFVLGRIPIAELGGTAAPESSEPVFEGRTYFEMWWRI